MKFNNCDLDYMFFFPSITRNGPKMNKKVSYSEVRRVIIGLCMNGGVDVSQIGTQSLRIGGCSEASRRGVPSYLLDKHGRWAENSSSRVRYQRVLEEDKVLVSRVLGRKNN